MNEIFGRSKELKVLKRVLHSEKAEFLALWGRRRVGKTFLIDRYFRTKGLYFHFTGMKDASLKEHLKLFRYALIQRFNKKRLPVFTNWLDAFLELRSIIDELDPAEKLILFFDELPWIATRKSGFLKVLEHFWNDYLSRRSNSVLVVCGSAASWMIEKIVKSKGGLHNRLTEKMRIDPFSLAETEKFLKCMHIDLSRKQIVDLYMVTGGVAEYLTHVRRGKSSAQMIQTLCFDKNSPLLLEYKILFSSLFQNYHRHLKVVETLSKHKSGLTHSQLLEKTKLQSGGSFTTLLHELKEAGFINVISSLNKKKKEARYYLCDEYCLFYHRWISNYKTQINENYWLEMLGSSRYLAWSGLAFESICKKHLDKIIKSLGIQVVALDAVYWSSRDNSAQIDLIIDRKDNTMNLCEIKYYNAPVAFDIKDAQAITFRKEKFKESTKTKKTLVSTLISPYGAKHNSAYFEAFDEELDLDALFEE